MTTSVWILLGITVVVAAVDWSAVYTGRRSLEYVAKPATMLPLIVAASVLDPGVPAMRGWFVAALVCSLVGDVFLMLPDSRRFFVPGLAAFLVGHVLYIVGLVQAPVSTMGIIVGAVCAFTVLLAVGPTLVKGASEVDPKLAIPVLGYMLTISVMVTCAIGAGEPVGIVGALLFYLSDFCIGWSRFVADFRHARIVIMVTYHLAQIALVVSLALH